MKRSGIARISVEGFKSLARQTIELGRLNVLIGANGSGKSALLEAMGLLGAAVTGVTEAAGAGEDHGKAHARLSGRPTKPRRLWCGRRRPETEHQRSAR